MQYDLINMLMFFLIYGFLGFLLETVFRSIVERRMIISRGFLTNLFCPLYGISGIVIVQIFTWSEITMNSRLTALIIATIGSILAVTLLEYTTGRVLDRAFHCKLWDYSQLPFNLHSYICLDFSLAWGIVAIILASIIHPLMEITVYAIPETSKLIFLYFAFSILITNASYNVRRMYHLNLIKL
ncbi:MAG: putative rane protein [Clostridia bacterium]|nr:putative rane protein [Clostridia bacterium]